MGTRLGLVMLMMVCGVAMAGYRRYDGYQIWRINGDPRLLRLFASAANEDPNLKDSWMASGFDFVDTLVSADQHEQVTNLARSTGVVPRVLEDDLQKAIEMERGEIESRQKFKDAAIVLTEYHTFEEIEAYLAELAATNDNVTLTSVGQTVEGRDLWVVRVGTSDTEKPAIWVDCGIHAREWITPATCLWILSSITTQYGVDAFVTQVMDHYDIHMMPVMNPDGYSFTWTDDRLWRKNRNPNPGFQCVGVDLNRNYNGTDWGGVGSSDIACDSTYHGESPFSEPETTAVSQQLLQLSTRKFPQKRSADKIAESLQDNPGNEIYDTNVHERNVPVVDKETGPDGVEAANSDAEHADGHEEVAEDDEEDEDEVEDQEDEDLYDDDEDEADDDNRVPRSEKIIVVKIQAEHAETKLSQNEEAFEHSENVELKSSRNKEKIENEPDAVNIRTDVNESSKSETKVTDNMNVEKVVELAEGNGLAISFSLHSYGALWLYAYGYTSELPLDHEEMERVSAAGVAGIASVNGSVYTPGPHYATIYPSTGTVVDYGYEHVGLIHTYIIESLSDGYGFQLPESLIAVTAEEVWRGMLAAILEL